MSIHILARKLRSARYRLERELAEWKESAQARRKRRMFDSWLGTLRAHPPDVLIGSNFAEFGGVRGHIHAIRKYSALNVQLAPPDELMAGLSPHDVKSTFRNAFLDFEPVGIRAAHSHVFPWFIEWSQRHRDSGRVWVHTYHLPYFPEHGGGALLPWQDEINDALIGDARHADVKVSVSLWQRAWLASNHGIESVYVPNGVDVELCDNGDGGRFTDRFGVEKFVLYVGRNDPVKNPADFARLAQRMPDQSFVMIGRELSPDRLLADWKVTIPKNLEIVGDADHSVVQDALAACSAVVVTSRREGLPTLVLEAMAHSKPVVVPDEAGCVEAIGGGDFGFIYVQNDIDDLVDKTNSALADSIVSGRGRARVLAEYDWRVVAPKLDRIYRGEAT